MHGVFAELSLVIIVTCIISLIMKLLKQPLILGYILSGLIVGPSFLGLIHSTETFEAFSELGIALLLFIIGLGMNIKELKKLGKVVMAVALTSLVIIGGTGFAIGSAIGFTKTESVIIGLALFFSSTIIIVKLLSDKKEQSRLHGQIAVGVILVEDIIATFVLLFIAAGKDGGFNLSDAGVLVLKGALLLLVLYIISAKVLPKASKYIATSQELLFLFAIGWAFGIATLFEIVGFSIEVGALFAGVTLAPLAYSQEIAARLRPLRDFFIVLFFIALGERMNLSNLSNGIGPAILLSLVVIILKPLVITTATGLLAYTKRVSFKTGVLLSQISEFSIVMVVLAASNGMVSEDLSAVITLVAIITIASSTYLIYYDDALFKRFDRLKINVFEKRAESFKEKKSKNSYPLVLFGYHKGGHQFINTFKQMGKSYLVIDYNPHVIDILEHQRIPYVYGDATDLELLDEIGIENTKLVVSTFSDYEVTKQLVHNLIRINPNVSIFCHADNKEKALELYEIGATYVMIPHYLGSEKISSFIKKSDLKKSELKEFKNKHIDYLGSSSSPAI